MIRPAVYQPSAAEEAELQRLLADRFDGFAPPIQTPRQVLGRRSTVGCVALAHRFRSQP